MNLMDSGSVVEQMIQEGRKIVSDAISEYRPIAIFAGFSGGNDSVVTTHFAMTQFGAHVLHCNTGIGMRATRSHVHDTCDRYRWHLIEEFAKPEGRPDCMPETDLPFGPWVDGGTAYEEYVLNFGFPGPGQHPRMYQRLKERSIRRHVSDLKKPYSRGSKVLIISGIRHDESAIRAGYKRAVAKPPKRPEVWVNPFYWRSAVDFEFYRQEFGLPRNPVKQRIGISGECLCGTFRDSPEERLAIRATDTEFSNYLDRLEDRVRDRGFPWNWGERPPRSFCDAKRGQGFLFAIDEQRFMPMCVGCSRR